MPLRHVFLKMPLTLKLEAKFGDRPVFFIQPTYRRHKVPKLR